MGLKFVHQCDVILSDMTSQCRQAIVWETPLIDVKVQWLLMYCDMRGATRWNWWTNTGWVVILEITCRRYISVIYGRILMGYDVSTSAWHHLIRYDVILSMDDTTGNAGYLILSLHEFQCILRRRVKLIDEFGVDDNTRNNFRCLMPGHL